MSAPHLKYTFLAEFADGSFLEQTQADKPTWAMREDGGGSAFTDVLNPKSPLIRFTLVGDNREYGVDLLTLNFSVASGSEVSQFRLFTQDELPLNDVKVYYTRLREENLDTQVQVQDDMSLKEISSTARPSIIKHYRVGLTGTNLLGKEITKFIEFD